MSGEVLPVTLIKADDLGQNLPPFVDPLLRLLNQDLAALSSLLAGGLLLPGNVSAFVKELEVRTLATYTSGAFTEVRFATGLRRKLVEVRVAQAIDRDDPEAVLSGSLRVHWIEDAGDVRVRWIDGLDASKRYWLRFLVI